MKQIFRTTYLESIKAFFCNWYSRLWARGTGKDLYAISMALYDGIYHGADEISDCLLFNYRSVKAAKSAIRKSIAIHKQSECRDKVSFHVFSMRKLKVKNHYLKIPKEDLPSCYKNLELNVEVRDVWAYLRVYVFHACTRHDDYNLIIKKAAGIA